MQIAIVHTPQGEYEVTRMGCLPLLLLLGGRNAAMNNSLSLVLEKTYYATAVYVLSNRSGDGTAGQLLAFCNKISTRRSHANGGCVLHFNPWLRIPDRGSRLDSRRSVSVPNILQQ